MKRLFRWLWPKRTPPKDIVEAEKRLAQIVRDDVKIDQLGRRVDKIIRENNLAPYIMRALEARH